MSNYKYFLNFTSLLNISDSDCDAKHIICDNTQTVIFDKPKEGEDETIYFLKLEKMYLDKMSFPIMVPSSSRNYEFEFCVMHYLDGETYHRIHARNLKKTGMILANTEYISQNLICHQINSLIAGYVKTVEVNSYFYLYVPVFDVLNGELTCTYKFMQGTIEKYEYPNVVGFNHAVYELLGKFFVCEWGKKDKLLGNLDETFDTDKFYYVYPFVDEVEYHSANYKHEENRIIYAAHNTDDFFYPERELILEMDRNRDPQFNEKETTYKKLTFPFRNKESIIELNKYILFANNSTIRESDITHHNFRLAVRIGNKFHCDTKIQIRVTGKLIPVVDKYDQFALFNLSVGDIYTEEQYQQLSFQKLLSLTTQNVYLQNQESTQVMKEIRDIILPMLTPYYDKDDCNLTLVLRKIYDVLCQSQDITNLGPPIRKKIKNGIDL